MLEKKRQDKIKPVAPLEKTITEILVANGRSVEPFVKVFTYSGENITKNPLGTLVGVFEIFEQSEESAYIVNFLASVAKKEYFSNTRRGAIESFEASLHKINLALAELVKHGNIAWLGKFHGVLGILEKNNLHFSATGQGRILLLRNSSLTEISAGLASEESHTHPIKTFVEVSSGHLLSQDRVIFTSPELLDLLPIEDVEKNALRMDKERFGQFLRTVLVNELDMAGTIIIDFQEGKSAPTPKKQEGVSEAPRNVFSQAAFIPKTKTPEIASSEKDGMTKASVQAQDIQEEYVDSKTGHIYVQGDTPSKTEANQNLERIKLSLQNVLHELGLFFASQGKLLHKGKKQSSIFLSELAKTSRVAVRKTARSLRKQWKKQFPQKPPIIQKEVSTALIKQEDVYVSEKSKPLSVPLPQPEPSVVREEKPLSADPAEADTEIPAFMRAKLAAFYQKNSLPKPEGQQKESQTKDFATISSDSFNAAFASAKDVSQKTLASLSLFVKHLSQIFRLSSERASFFLKNIPPQKQKVFLLGSIGIIIILVLGIILFRYVSSSKTAPVTEVSKPAIEMPVSPLNSEKDARLLEAPTTLVTQNDIVDSVLLNDETYLITKKSIMSLSDKKQYLIPTGSARLAAPMDHLSLIFIYTDTNELFAWSPINHTFVKNTLALPDGANVKSIDTYLTYLYILDSATNQIYRFPRAEGGFGQSSAWLKDSVVFDENVKMSVSETIFLAPNTTSVRAFFQGRLLKEFEAPRTALSVTSLYAHPDLANIYALDTENNRILVWNQDGALLAQFFSEKLADAMTITVNKKTSEAIITTSDSLLSFKFSL